MSSWHNYPSIYTLGHKAIVELFLDPVIVQEKIDGCVSPETPILCADLTYRQAKDLKPGDELVAFDDKLVGARLVKGVVIHNVPVRKPCWIVETDSRVVIASGDHPWLVRNIRPGHAPKRWVKTVNLRVGDAIVSVKSWLAEKTWESGYLAGQYDGEGTLVRCGYGRVLAYYQKIGNEMDQVMSLLAERGFKISLDVRRRKAHYSLVGGLTLHGGWPEIIRFLGTFRPRRLLAKAESVWLGSPLNAIGHEKIRRLERIGFREVAGLGTSSHTYIADGLFSHNSQISFGLFPATEDELATAITAYLTHRSSATGDTNPYRLRVRSKGVEQNVHAPDKMFASAVAIILERLDQLVPGYTYRGEYLLKPKHNTLAYDRVPNHHIILFDINDAEESYLDPTQVRTLAARLGLEAVPTIHYGMLETVDQLRGYLDLTSVLGGQKVEGIVVKNYARFGPDKKALMGKYVSEAFKEVHKGEWRKANPTGGDIIDQLVATYRTPSRWAKAVQHLREAGQLEDAPRDIGKLLQEIPLDVAQECGEEIREVLWNWAWPRMRRAMASGFADWYKQQLLERQFSQADK